MELRSGLVGFADHNRATGHKVDAKQENRAVYLLESLSLTSSTTLTGGVGSNGFTLTLPTFFDATAPNPTFINGGSPSGEQNERQYAWELGLRQALSEQWSAFTRATRGLSLCDRG